MDDILPDVLTEWEAGDDTSGTEDAADLGEVPVEEGAEDSGETGEVLDDGIDLDEIPVDETAIDDNGAAGGDAADGGDMVDDGDYSGEDILVWEGDPLEEDAGLDGSLIEESFIDDGIVDDGASDGLAADGGELVSDGGYDGDDLFLWDSGLGSEDVTVIEYFVWEPMILDEFIFTDDGSQTTDEPVAGETGQVDGTDITLEIWDGWLEFPCFPVDAIA